MKKRDFNLVGNEGTDNQELAKGIAFVKSRRAELNVVQMVESMRDQAIPNGVIINDAYCDRSMTRDYDREALNAFFATLKEENHSGRDKQVPAVKDCRFTQTAFGTVVHDSRGKWLGQYETEDAAVEMIREMAQDIGGYDDEI